MFSYEISHIVFSVIMLVHVDVLLGEVLLLRKDVSSAWLML